MLGSDQCLGTRGHSFLKKSPGTVPGAQRSCIHSHQCPLALCLEKYVDKNLSSPVVPWSMPHGHEGQLLGVETAPCSFPCLPTLQLPFAGSWAILHSPEASLDLEIRYFLGSAFSLLRWSLRPHPLLLPPAPLDDHITELTLSPHSHQIVSIRWHLFAEKSKIIMLCALMRQCPSCSTLQFKSQSCPTELLPLDLPISVRVFCIINDMLGF